MRSFGIMLLIGMTVGCGQVENEGVVEPVEVQDVDVNRAVVADIGGYIGGSEAFISEAYTTQFVENSYRSYTNIFAHTNEGNVAMVGLHFYQSNIRDLPVGTHVYEGSDDVVGVGCVGPEEYNWVYDNSADVITLVIRDEEDLRIIDYAFEFVSLSGVTTDFLSGSITYNY